MSALPALPQPAVADQGVALARLHAFSFLPSRHWHPARVAPWHDELQALGTLAQQPALQRVLHRRWSARLLAQFDGAQTGLMDLSEPALPLALAEPGVLAQVARLAGALLVAPFLRRSVLRSAVLALREVFGADTLRWVCMQGAALHPGVADARPWLPQGLAAEDAGADDWQRVADALGAGLLAQAWQDAPPGLRQRADIRLPPEADDPATRAASGLPPAAARGLSLQLLARLEPTWLSLFPATR